MVSSKRKRKNRIIPIIIILLLAAAAAFLLVKAAEKITYEFRLSEHPLKYSEYIEKYSDEYGLDKYLIYAYVKTESSFDEKAVSDTGARGLMQIMEETFDWIKYRLGDSDDVTYDDMFKPQMNIRYGTYLVHYLNEYFGSSDTAAAAYFSGIGTVSDWVSDSRYSSDGVNLITIPSKGAAHYVNKINNAYDTYKELYKNERK